MASLCGTGITKNLIIFLTMLIVNWMFILFWFPVTEVYRSTLVIIIPFWISQILSHTANYLFISQQLYEVYKQFPHEVISYFTHVPFSIRYLFVPIYRLIATSAMDEFAFLALLTLPNILRILLSIIFVGSILLRPLVMHPINLVWRRIIESEKPVFTVIFGGAAAIVTAMGEVAKHL
jgi:hypothetical protein